MSSEERVTRATVITGAAGAIGSAIASRLRAAGGRLALLDADARALRQAADELGGASGAVLTVTCDVGSGHEITAAIDQVVRAFGAPSGLVTAAGIDRGGHASELAAADFEDVIRVNLSGTFLACQACLRPMIEARAGSIVCISSPLAFASTPGSGAYAASKAGVSALVRSLAIDHAADRIRVNAVLPGPTESELMWAKVPPDRRPELRRTVAAEVPLGRMAEPDEVAAAATWLLSEDSSYVTGAQLACDGGVLAKASVSV
jgi:NAD(P)-dependent dehydrogenase (short-subunit alcohol dehydrogenase family)